MEIPKKGDVLLNEQGKSQTCAHTVMQFSYIWTCIADGW